MTFHVFHVSLITDLSSNVDNHLLPAALSNSLSQPFAPQRCVFIARI